jgi:hypothetical protein
VNGDSRTDLVYGNGYKVKVLFGNGDGTFGAAVDTNWSGDFGVGDFNGDGEADLIITASGYLFSLLGNGDGTFRLVATYSISAGENMLVADFNRDGKLDIAFGGLTVLLGNGDGTFQPQINYPNGGSYMAAGDFNGDGNIDIATSDGEETVNVFLGNGDGTFQTPQDVNVGGIFPASIAVGDFNGDGMADLAVASYASDAVSIVAGKGDGSFWPPVTYFVTAPETVVVGDFNGDGKADLALCNYVEANLTVLLGNGNGTFQQPVIYAIGGEAIALVVGDFNGDGRADLAIGDYPGPVSIILGAAPAKPSEAGVFRDNFEWILDANGNRIFDGTGPGQDYVYNNFIPALPGDIPVVGDWSGSGTTKIGIYRPSTGQWFLDYNGNGTFDAGDKTYNFGGIAGDIPVVGDWTGSGTAKIGIFRSGFFWILDINGNGSYDAGDQAFAYGGVPGDVPVTGDWSGNGVTKVGVVRPFQTGGTPAFWLLDANNDHAIDSGDLIFAFGGIAGDVPVVGDWNGSGFSKAGVYREGFYWVIDNNGSAPFTLGSSQVVAFAFGGVPGDVPVVGKW